MLFVTTAARPSAAYAAALPSWLTVPAQSALLPAGNTHVGIKTTRLDQLQAEGVTAADSLRRFDFLIRADGRVEEHVYFARQLITATGVGQYGTLALGVQTATDHLFLEQAFVVPRVGPRRAFDAATLQVVDAQSGDIFSDSRSVVLPFGGLSAGDTAVVGARVVRDMRRWPLPWAEILSTRAGLPIEHFDVSVSWEAGVTVPVWKTDDPALKCAITSARRFRCTREAVPALADDPDMRGWRDTVPSLVVGLPGGWDELAQASRALLESRVGGDGAVATVAANITAGATSEEDRLRRIFRFVADQIRYVGMEHGTSAVVPHQANVTLQRRFGDCKDKVTLFLALARKVGIKAFAALVATEHFAPDKLLLPTWRYFDHMIACVGGEKPTCVDPTASDGAVGDLPLGLRGAVYLPLDGAAAAHPAKLPEDGVAWDIAISAKNLIRCDGSTEETLQRTFTGAGAGMMRRLLRAKTVNERLRWLEERFRDVMGSDVHPTFEVDNIDQPDAEIVVRSRALYVGHKRLTQMSSYRDGDPWLADLAKSMRTRNRHLPYMNGGLRIRARATYDLCPEVLTRFHGARLDFKSEFGSLKRQYDHLGGTIRVTTDLELPPRIVPVRNIERYNRFIDTTLEQGRIWFDLTPVATKAGRGAP